MMGQGDGGEAGLGEVLYRLRQTMPQMTVFGGKTDPGDRLGFQYVNALADLRVFQKSFDNGLPANLSGPAVSTLLLESQR
jgi:hypothetical protein